MRKGLIVLGCLLIITLLSGCNAANEPTDVQQSEPTNVQQSEPKSEESAKTPPVIDHLDVYPFPIPSAWQQERFEVRQYDEGMDWEAVFTFAGDVTEEALAYREVIEELGYEIQVLFNQVFKIGTAELAGVIYHGTFTFEVGDEYSEWGEGQGYLEVSFSEKQN